MEFIEVSAKTVDDAITKACIELQAASDKLEIQVISEGSSGFFGIGSKPAVIRAAVKAAPEKEPEAPQKPEKKEAAPAPVKEAPKKEAVKKETERKSAPRQAETARRSEPREEREVVQRTDEEIAQIKATALEFLSGVFKAMELPVEIQMEYNAENGSLEVDFAGEDMGILIGKRGQTLDSLQYLTSLVVNKEQKDYVRVKLDTENYRKRRKETLENLASKGELIWRKSIQSQLTAINCLRKAFFRHALRLRKRVPVFGNPCGFRRERVFLILFFCYSSNAWRMLS